MFSFSDYYFVFVLLFLLFYVTIYKKNNLYFKHYEGYLYKSNKNNLFIICFLIMNFYLILTILTENYNNCTLFYVFNFVVLYKIFLFIFNIFFLIFFKYYSFLTKFYSYESIWIFMFCILCLTLLIDANNFLYFFIIIEGYSLSVLSVLVLKKLNKKLLFSSFNYLVFNVIISCLMLYSISLIYFSTGLMTFSDINDTSNNFVILFNNNIFTVGIITFIFCFFMKLSIFPFSFYLSQVYSNFSFIFLFFFLLIPKLCFSIFFFSNFFFVLNNVYCFVNNILGVLLLVTSILHALLSIKNLNTKNFLINTSFSNIPFILSYIYFKNVFLIAGFFNFMFVYFFNLLCFFFVIFTICINKNYVYNRFINLYGLIYNNFYLSVCIATLFLSLSSLPPFSGFFVKFFMFYFFIEYKMYFLYFFLSFVNLIAVYAYIRIFKILFNKKKNFYVKNFFFCNIYLFYFVFLFMFINIFFVFFFDIIYKIIFIFLNFNIIL